MSRYGRLLIGVLVLLLSASAVFAEGPGKKDPQKQTEALSKKYNLTDAQRGQIEQIMSDYNARIEALKGQMQALVKEKQEKINAVINAAQQEKHDKIKQRKDKPSTR